MAIVTRYLLKAEHWTYDLSHWASQNDISIDAGLKLKALPFEDLVFAKIDHHRQLRQDSLKLSIVKAKRLNRSLLLQKNFADRADNNILATRANYDVYKAVAAKIPDAEHYGLARLILIRRGEQEKRGHILVLSAGTSDLPVAEEAAITAEAMGKVAHYQDSLRNVAPEYEDCRRIAEEYEIPLKEVYDNIKCTAYQQLELGTKVNSD